MRRPRARRPVLEFLCRPEDEGVIAAPQPAQALVPDWLRALPGVDPDRVSATNDGRTVKRCLPFLDALSLGWILPLAADVRLEIADDGKTVHAGWSHDQELVSDHAPYQVAGNPHEPRPPMKFHNPWTIVTAPGWSCLFVPPVNRPNGVFEVFAGVVDTDTYRAPVNLPFVATGPDGVHTLRRGTPLAQVIPFRREAMAGVVRAETPEEAEARSRIHRHTNAGAGWYRRAARATRGR